MFLPAEGFLGGGGGGSLVIVGLERRAVKRCRREPLFLLLIFSLLMGTQKWSNFLTVHFKSATVVVNNYSK